MDINVPPDDRPRRELEEAALVSEYGLEFLSITVLRVAGVKKDGEVRYKSLEGRYRVERVAPGHVRLWKGDGTAYNVTCWNCSCQDETFKGKERWCKHRTACEAVGLLSAPPMPQVLDEPRAAGGVARDEVDDVEAFLGRNTRGA